MPHRSIPSAVARSRVVGAVSTRRVPVTTAVPDSGSAQVSASSDQAELSERSTVR